MSVRSKVLDALTMRGADDALDVLAKLCLIAIAGATFVTGCALLLAEAVR